MSDFTPKLNLPYLLPNQAHKHVTMNTALQLIDVVVQLVLSGLGLSSPPPSPSDGASFGLSSSPSGIWQGHGLAVATYIDGTWHFSTPQTGWRAWNLEDESLYVFGGQGWSRVSGHSQPGLGDVLTTDLQTTRLGVATETPRYTLDVNGQIGCLADSPGINMTETDQVQDEKTWRFNAASGNLFIQALNDTSTTASTGMVLTRTGAQVESVRFMTSDAIAVYVSSQQNVAIGHAAPTTRLDVDGPVRVGQYQTAGLPSAGSVGAGTIVFVTNASGGAQMAYSDGTRWRRMTDRSAI